MSASPIRDHHMGRIASDCPHCATYQRELRDAQDNAVGLSVELMLARSIARVVDHALDLAVKHLDEDRPDDAAVLVARARARLAEIQTESVRSEGVAAPTEGST